MKCLTTKNGAKNAPKTTVRKDNGGPHGNGANPRSMNPEKAVRDALGAIPAKLGMTAAEAHGVGITVKETGTVITTTGVGAVAMAATATRGNHGNLAMSATVETGVLRGVGVVISRTAATNGATRVDSIIAATAMTTAGTGAIGTIET